MSAPQSHTVLTDRDGNAQMLTSTSPVKGLSNNTDGENKPVSKTMDFHRRALESRMAAEDKYAHHFNHASTDHHTTYFPTAAASTDGNFDTTTTTSTPPPSAAIKAQLETDSDTEHGHYEFYRKQGHYVSPSDAIQSPATKKLGEFRSKQAMKKANPRTLFARQLSQMSVADDGFAPEQQDKKAATSNADGRTS